MGDESYVTPSDLDDYMAMRDERVRSIVSQSISDALRNGLGERIRDEVYRGVDSAMKPVVAQIQEIQDSREEVDRTLYGDARNEVVGLVTQVHQVRGLLDRLQWALSGAKWLIPVVGVDVIVRAFPLVESLSG